MSQPTERMDELRYIYDLEEPWTPQEVADFLSVKITTVREHCRRRSVKPIPHFKVGKFLRFDPRAVKEWLFQNRQGYTADFDPRRMTKTKSYRELPS